MHRSLVKESGSVCFFILPLLFSTSLFFSCRLLAGKELVTKYGLYIHVVSCIVISFPSCVWVGILNLIVSIPVLYIPTS